MGAARSQQYITTGKVEMRMPQDFVDAINAAVREVNPDAGTMTHGSMTLGTDFDEWCGIEAIRKYGFDPMPPEATAAFEAKFNERRAELKASLVASAIDVERRRMAGTLIDQPPRTGRTPRKLSEIVADLDGGNHQQSTTEPK